MFAIVRHLVTPVTFCFKLFGAVKLFGAKQKAHDEARLGEFVARLRALEAQIYAYLCNPCTATKTDVMPAERRFTDDLCDFFTKKKRADVVDLVRRWSQLMTAEPFGATTVRAKLKVSDAGILIRQEKTAELMSLLVKIRREHA